MVVELCEGRCSEDERMDVKGFIYALTSHESEENNTAPPIDMSYNLYKYHCHGSEVVEF